MAERIVSPGVFTNEVDLSFLPAAVSEIGAALVGICSKGPAFVPTLVDNFADFKLKFGGLNPDFYLPYAAKSYLKNAGTCTIVRVLGETGYTANDSLIIKGAGTGGSKATTSITLNSKASGSANAGKELTFTGSNGEVYVFEPWAGTSFNVDGPGSFGLSNPSGNTYFWQLHASKHSGSAENLRDAVNLGTSTHGITSATQSVAGKVNVSFSSSANTSVFNSTSVNTGSSELFSVGDVSSNFFAGGAETVNAFALAALFSTASNATQGLTGATIGGAGKVNNFNVLYDSKVYPTMSLLSTDNTYLVDVAGSGPSPSAPLPFYVGKIFKQQCDAQTASSTISHVNGKDHTFDGSAGGGGGYSEASTPFIISQTGSAATDVTELFKFETLSHGKSSNTEVKIAFANIKAAGTVAGSDYGTFDVIIRKFDDTDKRPTALESFAGCNLDPDSPNYIVRKIGDMKQSFDTTKNKVMVTGDYANKSKYVRITNMNSQIDSKTASPNLIPFGFRPYKYPMVTSISEVAVPIPVRMNQTSSGEYNSKLYHGLAFDSGSSLAAGYAKDILTYLDEIPGSTLISSSEFRLDQVGLAPASTLGTKKFIMGLQGGTDGFDPRFFGGPNSDGQYYGLGKARTSDTGSFNNAISTISNPDETDINMLVVPGINKKNFSKVHVKARDVVEDRQDTFYIFDAGDWNSNISDWTSQVSTEDSNYAATYFPWVKIFDDENNKNVWVPPSVVIPGVVAFTDKVSHPWFAPAGLNRGGLTEALMAKERLTHAERDDLYEERVNPIATFPGQGVCVWGQKTLQAKPSALDRVNVRRLLIKCKKFIASTSRFLVFEQNTAQTRNRFLNIVNPFLEQVQSNQGLTAFKVVMDESNNTPDVIDRNQLVGQLFIQPARTAEFIVLDFVVLPTGATFPE